MKEIILIKVGEIVLKGLNRRQFEDKLLKNIRNTIKHLGSFEVKISQSTISVIPQDEFIDLDEVSDRISKVFGIVTYSRAAQCPEKTLESVMETAVDYLGDTLSETKTFKVTDKEHTAQVISGYDESCCSDGMKEHFYCPKCNLYYPGDGKEAQGEGYPDESVFVIPAHPPPGQCQVLRAEHQHILTADMLNGRALPHVPEFFKSGHFQFAGESPSVLQIL